MMVNFKLIEEMRKDVISMSQALEKKSESRKEFGTCDISQHRSEALTTELRRTRGMLGHIQGSCMSCVPARTKNVESVMCVINEE